MNDAHVENKKYPRGDLRFSTWIFEKGGDWTNFPVKICKAIRGQKVEIGVDRSDQSYRRYRSRSEVSEGYVAV